MPTRAVRPSRRTKISRIGLGGNSIKKFEEFAIDWVQLRDGRLFDADGGRNEQWYGFGADVVAVADGSVSVAFDGMGEQTPNTPGVTLARRVGSAGCSQLAACRRADTHARGREFCSARL
jgi:hypothetical protein